MREPHQRTKVVLRRLPPAIPPAVVTEQIDSRFAGCYDWCSFRPGRPGQKDFRFSRVYLNFKNPEHVVEFAEFFNGHTFVNEKGAQFKAVVEYAPSQQVPKLHSKKDGREGTISKDPEYLEFLERIAKPADHLPSAEIQLERKEAERASAGKEAPVVTPLMAFVRQQRAAKSAAQRPGGRLSRKTVGIVTNSSNPPKRGSEKRRTSSSTYVLRDSSKDSKEKQTYILASRKEDAVVKDKVQVLEDAPSVKISGASSIAEGKNDKIVILKGRSRADSQVSDGLNTKSSSPSGQDLRVEESHVSSIEKGRRPPRPSNLRAYIKDQILDSDKGIHADDNLSTNSMQDSISVGERTDRPARNRDRPDRGVWTPRRLDRSPSAELQLTQSQPGENVAPQQAVERKSDILVTRREDAKGYGGGRGTPIENGSHRNGARRGPRGGPKEFDGPSSSYEGKHSKKGSIGYGSHERQVWVQKSGSTS